MGEISREQNVSSGWRGTCRIYAVQIFENLKVDGRIFVIINEGKVINCTTTVDLKKKSEMFVKNWL